MTPDLSGRTALVTGGGRGIGAAAVRALAEAGARVTWTTRSPATLEEGRAALGGIATGVLCDVLDREGMARLLAPGVDVLVNNAGVIGPMGPLAEADPDDWAATVRTNLIGPAQAIHDALPAMLARGGATVVNVSSGAAHRAVEGWSAYCASKAALWMLTRSLHLEYGDRGIRAFGLAPGVVDTAMQVAIRASGVGPVARIPREALAAPDRPGRAIAWLCGPDADPWRGEDLDVRAEPLLSAVP